MFFYFIYLVLQVSARLISCRRECQEEPKSTDQPREQEGSAEASAVDQAAKGSGCGLAERSGEGSADEKSEVRELSCSTGRKITNVCDGQKDCPAQGEDEMFEECYKILKDYDDEDEPQKLCATIWAGNELVPQFPCFKTGHCIDSKLVR